MARSPKLTFDRGTLILHPPPRGKAWVDYATWDDRIEKFRVPAWCYPQLVNCLQQEGIDFLDQVSTWPSLTLTPRVVMDPYPHQREALHAWHQAGRKGVVVLPTAAGKTYLAQLALQSTAQPTLIVVPTLDLMHQWYAHLSAAFPDAEIGLLGGGSHDRTLLLVATYDSAAIYAETLGNQYAFIIFDECHHLPSTFNRVIAEYAVAPYRLGLTATPERADGGHHDLSTLIGPEIYRKTADALAGTALAPYEIVQIKVQLSEKERDRYRALMQQRNSFLKLARIKLNGLEGWQEFVRESARSSTGRQAMLAHYEARAIALGTEGKLRVLSDLLAQHHPESTLIFTNDNATVYRISQDFLIPAITHQTPVKERHVILTHFREGHYRTLVASHVLNEGVDVPETRIAIILSGTGSTREFIQRLGRVLRRGNQPDKHAILYEVIAEATLEERTAQRRKGDSFSQPTPYPTPDILPFPPSPASPYTVPGRSPLRAAEDTLPWTPPETP